MATYEEALAKFKQEMDNIGMHHDEEVYHAITDYLVAQAISY